MNRLTNLLLTALAPAVWGSTYIVTSELLPAGYPVTLAVLRALPAGLLLLLLVRRLPGRAWWGRLLLLGAFNFAIFWTLLFVAAYRLPGGVAATLGSLQALWVVLLARGLLGTPIMTLSVMAALAGAGGVALLVLTPAAELDPLGLAAGLGGALSMSAGTVLSRKWQPPVSPLTFTAWQLTAGGLLLAPLAWFGEPVLPALTTTNLVGLGYLGLIGAALTYFLWFRGVARIEPAAVSMLGMMSPLTAVALGWMLLDQRLSPLQAGGAMIVLGSVWLGQWAARRGSRPATGAHSTTWPLPR
ncbi:putative blue pigment (indigoidine) exporter [Halomonas ventosae]|uniref:Putative blue pigment (Indigoidine) exporter n=1 Tax=Halomonas ventosae TaxID=229007 RepID=A0A4R6ZDR3_9GAMM|nr:EamA family transporter [Halomonas ventosae]TDR50291.1 putative blue pigment (indigoidine) exporter [Halomonas ventosae]